MVEYRDINCTQNIAHIPMPTLSMPGKFITLAKTWRYSSPDQNIDFILLHFFQTLGTGITSRTGIMGHYPMAIIPSLNALWSIMTIYQQALNQSEGSIYLMRVIIWWYYPRFKLVPEAIAEGTNVRGVISQLAHLDYKHFLIPQGKAECLFF